MKKRLAALALCLVFTGTLIAVPKARASLVGAGAAAVGAAVLATYMAASGLTINTDSVETVATGLDSLAEDYLADTGSTETVESWLSTIAGLVTVPGAGVLQFPASVVRIVGGFVDWVTGVLDLHVGVDLPVYSKSGFLMSDGSLLEIPWTPSSFTDYNNVLDYYPDIPVYELPCKFVFSNGAYLYFYYDNFVRYEERRPDGTISTGYLDATKNAKYVCLFLRDIFGSKFRQNYYDENMNLLDYSLVFDYSYFQDLEASSNLGITLEPGFSNPANENDFSEESKNSLSIFLPQSITSSDALPIVIPEMILNRELAPTYELTQEGTGEGTDTEDGTGADDTTVGLLQSILQGVKSIGNTFTDSLTDAFTPSQEAVDSLAAEVDAKLPIIPTLQNFGSDLVYKLEHPESCANGLGLTTVVDLKKGRGTYLGNTAHNLLDVSWYLEYKPLVDDIIVGFCWLGFLWNCYGALPRIIHGEGAIAGAITVLRKEDTGDDR